MEDDVQLVFEEVKDSMKKSLSHLEAELSRIRAGKASPSMLENVFVDYYGTRTPLNQVSNTNAPDGRTLTVQPWEKGMIEPIEKAIIDANLGLNPQNNGDIIIINIPPLTEERRTALVKQVKSETEDAKVSIRNARRDANEEIKKLQKEGLSEDAAKDAEEQVQELTDQYTGRADKLAEAKEKDIMTV